MIKIKHINKKLVKRFTALVLVSTMTASDIPFQWLNNRNAIAAEETVAEESTVEDENVYIIGEDIDKRDEYTKTFLRSDGLYTAVSYALPIHYEAEDGKYEEIDNTLKTCVDEKGEKSYGNAANDFAVTFPKTLNDNNEVKVSKGEYSVSFILNKVNESNADINQNAKIEQAQAYAQMAESEIEEAKNEENKLSDVNVSSDVAEDVVNQEVISEAVGEIKTNSGISYEEVFENTNIDYNISSKTLKESIVLNEKPDNMPEKALEYTYNIKTEGLTAKINDDKSISFMNEEKEIFKMPALYMYGSSYSISEDIEVTLEAVADGYKMTLTPSSEWLNSDERQYPVTIDPTVSTSKGSSSVNDTYVDNSRGTTIFGTSATMGVLSETSSNGLEQSYIKFTALPYMNSGYIINNVKPELS